jgi:hypothetical protein
MNIDKMYVGQKFSLLLPEGDKMDFQVRRVTFDGVMTNTVFLTQQMLLKAGVINEMLGPYGLSTELFLGFMAEKPEMDYEKYQLD